MTQHRSESQSGRRMALACVLLALVTLVVYVPALSNGFVNWDDDEYVVENTALQKLDGETFVWAFTEFHSSNWHPLTWLSHAVDWQLFGASAGGHHLVNVLWHALNAALLAWVLWRFTGDAAPSAFVAALFALHPLHVESVAWVTERKDVLSTFFWLGTMLLYLRYVERRGAGRYAWVMLCFAAGLMSKPMLVTLPFVLLLLDFWPLRRFSWTAVLEKLPLIGLAASSSLLTVLAQRAKGSAASLERLGLDERIPHAIVSYARYLGKTLWPAELVTYYPYESNEPYQSWPVLLAIVALLAAVTVGAFLWRGRRPYLLVGWLWYVGTLVPVIGIMQVGTQAIADRYTYVPLTGAFVMLAWTLHELFPQGKGRVALGVVAGVVLLALSLRTVEQIRTWESSTTLWRHNLQAYPEATLAHMMLADAHEAKLRVNAEDIDALNNLGNFYMRKKDYDRAAELYERSIELYPGQVTAYDHLGAVRIRQKRIAEAIELHRIAHERDPSDVGVMINLGAALAQSGELPRAMELWHEVVRLQPDVVQAHLNLGQAYSMAGDLARAEEHFRAALELQPTNERARRGLARIEGGRP
ncbi:MAG: tetratricopeptide repeat protein [bacterium]|nr:tetratricopeptide repeat protein [bacterium]